MASRHVRQVLEHPKGIHFAHRARAPAAEIEPAIDDAAAIGREEVVQFAVHEIGAEDHAHSFRRERSVGQPGVGQRQIGRREAKLNVARHHLQAFSRADVRLGIEIENFPAKIGPKAASVERLQRSDAGLPLDERAPERVTPDPNRADDPHSGDNHILRQMHGVR